MVEVILDNGQTRDPFVKLKDDWWKNRPLSLTIFQHQSISLVNQLPIIRWQMAPRCSLTAVWVESDFCCISFQYIVELKGSYS